MHFRLLKESPGEQIDTQVVIDHWIFPGWFVSRLYWLVMEHATPLGDVSTADNQDLGVVAPQHK